MLDTSYVTRLRIKQDKELDEYRKDNRDAYKELNIFKRHRLTKINDLIYNLVKAIENESGWTYTPSKFTCYSNYSYDGKEIVFDINSISSNPNGYHLSDNPSSKEIEFYNKYQEMLKRLFELEKRREELIPKRDPQIIPISRIVTREGRIKENQDNNFISSFTNFQAYEFVKEFKSSGIRTLVKLLNELTESEDIMKAYNSLYTGGMNHYYAQELLRWAALYTPRGQQLLDKIARERQEKEYWLSGFPSMEDRMTKNMIDLHL